MQDKQIRGRAAVRQLVERGWTPGPGHGGQEGAGGGLGTVAPELGRPWRRMNGRLASVSTLLTSVGRPSTPSSNGRGGLSVGLAGPPLIDPHRGRSPRRRCRPGRRSPRSPAAAPGARRRWPAPLPPRSRHAGRRRRRMPRRAPTIRAASRRPSSTRCGRLRSSQRSLTEAGSPSSPLASTTVWRPAWAAARTVRSLTASGNAAPPRPSRPRAGHLVEQRVGIVGGPVAAGVHVLREFFGGGTDAQQPGGQSGPDVDLEIGCGGCHDRIFLSTVRLTAMRTAVVRVDVDPSGRLTPAQLAEGMAALRELCRPVGAEVIDVDLSVMPSNRREVEVLLAGDDGETLRAAVVTLCAKAFGDRRPARGADLRQPWHR